MPDIQHTDSITSIGVLQLPADTIANDSIEVIPAIVITDTSHEDVGIPRVESMSASWWVMAVLLGLFVVACIKFRNNFKYFNALFTDLTDVRERHNLFDDTVRESSFLIVLNLLFTACAGVLLYSAATLTIPQSQIIDPDTGIGICIGIIAIYSLVMSIAYRIVGYVFSDTIHAGMWVRGFGASQALLGTVLFPIALMVILNTGHLNELLLVAILMIAIAKIMFISKGFRIFFKQISSWVLFLYYLCSLEIVPLILVYLIVVHLCTLGA